VVGVAEDCSAILRGTRIGNLTHYVVRIYGILEVYDAEALDVWTLHTAGLLDVCYEVVILLRYLRVNVEDQEILLAPPRETSLLGIEILNLDIAYWTW
jgi:hypothetical protein